MAHPLKAVLELPRVHHHVRKVVGSVVGHRSKPDLHRPARQRHVHAAWQTRKHMCYIKAGSTIAASHVGNNETCGSPSRRTSEGVSSALAHPHGDAHGRCHPGMSTQ